MGRVETTLNRGWFPCPFLILFGDLVFHHQNKYLLEMIFPFLLGDFQYVQKKDIYQPLMKPRTIDSFDFPMN